MGSLKGLRYLLSGGNEDIIYMPNLDCRDAYITMPCLYYISPDPNFYKGSALVRANGRIYTADDYEQLFKDRNDARGYEIFKKN